MTAELWLIIINLVLWPMLAYGLHRGLIAGTGFVAAIAILVSFNLAWLVYTQQQDQLIKDLSDRLAEVESQSEKLSSIESRLIPLIDIQAQLTVQSLSQMTGRESLMILQKRIELAEEVEAHLVNFGMESSQAKASVLPIQEGVNKVLMEQLSQLLVQEIGRRNYLEFMGKYPREKWTDALFLKEIPAYLNTNKLNSPALVKMLATIERYKRTGKL